MASIDSDSLSLPSHNTGGLICVLPDEIIEQILGSLSLRQRAVASFVSRKWRRTITSFHDKNLVLTHTSCGYCKREPCLRSSGRCYSIDRVIKLASADNDTTFTEFYLFVRPNKLRFSSSYTFLDSAITESRLLTVLHLKGCKIENTAFCNIEELPSLKEIYFDSVCICPSSFSRFISNCHSIVELTLKNCHHHQYQLYSISVPDLNQLKKVHVNGNTFELIEIKAQNLLEFHLFISSSSSSAPQKIDLCTCTKLQVLNIDCEYLSIGFLENIFSAFPSLRSLFLRRLKLNKIKILSPTLEYLTLSDMVHLDDIIVDTPNLRSFKLLDIKNVPSSSAVDGSRLREVEIGLKYEINAINRLLHLRTFAETLGENLTFSLASNTIESKEARFHLGNLGSNIQPLCIKHINLEILSYRSLPYESFIDEMFSYFHPQTLAVKVISLSSFDLVQVLLDELNTPGRECCMCWRHFLKGFTILKSTGRQNNTPEVIFKFQWCEAIEEFANSYFGGTHHVGTT